MFLLLSGKSQGPGENLIYRPSVSSNYVFFNYIIYQELGKHSRIISTKVLEYISIENVIIMSKIICPFPEKISLPPTAAKNSEAGMFSLNS